MKPARRAPRAEGGGAPWAALALVAVGAGLRLANLGRDELWLDEAETANQVALTFQGMVESTAHDNKPPLFYLVLQAWTRLAGESETALRFPSAVAGVGMVWLLLLLGRRLGSERAGLGAAAAAALSPLAVHYSQEARNHGLTAMLVVLALWCLDRALASRSFRDWAFYSLAVAGCLLTQYTAAPALLAGFALVAAQRERVAWARWILASLAGLVPLLPWAAVISRQLGVAASTVSWLPPYWQAYPPALAIPLSLRAFMPGGDVPSFVALSTPASIQLPLALGAAMVLLIAFWPGQGRRLAPAPRAGLLLAGLACFLPLLAQWAISFRTPIYMVGRTDFVAFPGFCLLVGSAFARLSSRSLRLAAAGAFLAASLAGLHASATAAPLGGQRQPLAKLAGSLADHDLLVATGLSRPATQYYLRRAAPRKRLQILSYPRALEHNPAVFDAAAFAAQPEVLRRDAEAVASRVARLPPGRTALLFWVDKARAINLPLLEALAPTHRLVPSELVPLYRLSHVGTKVEVFEIRPLGRGQGQGAAR